MERIVVRFDVDPAAAEVVNRALGQVLDHVVVQLSQEPVPMHTKRALEAQREHLESSRRGLQLAIANPIAIDDEGRVIE